MSSVDLSQLSAFEAVARLRSFRKAADELELSASTLSHQMRAMEDRLQVRLLDRTTRSVKPTQAGEALLEKLRPALRDLDGALAVLTDHGGATRGTLRIDAPAAARHFGLAKVASVFHARYPEVALDLVSSAHSNDIVAAGFDAGIRLREQVPAEMVAVPLEKTARFFPVATRGYLRRHGTPRTPNDLMQHQCIRYRMLDGTLYRWEFERRGKTLALQVPGTLTSDDPDLMVDLALAGAGIAYVSDSMARPHLESGRLVALLDAWCPSYPGACLFYPGRRLVPPPLRAFIEVVREVCR